MIDAENDNGIRHVISPMAGPLSDVLRSLYIVNPGELLALGAIYKNKRRILKPTVEILRGDYLRIHSQPKRYQVNHIDWATRIAAHNKDFVLVDKPSGIPVHPMSDNIQENVLTQLGDHLKVLLLPTNRIDVPTSGLVLFARNETFQRQFNEWLRNRQVRKEYDALVESPVPHHGLLVHYMDKGPRAPKQVCVTEGNGWQRCELEILEQEMENGVCRVRIRLLTGRTHQIRCQLSALGRPILGDAMYGGRPWIENGGATNAIALRCSRLQFGEWDFKLPGVPTEATLGTAV